MIPTLDRLVARITIDRAGCWVVSGYGDGRGYRLIRDKGRLVYTHQLMYETVVGPIPAGQIDHLCRNRACCRPSHQRYRARRTVALAGAE